MKYSEFFTCKVRPDETRYWVLKEEAPYELKESVYSIHQELFFGAMLNEWIYEEISLAFDRLEECASEENYDDALCDIEADMSTNEFLEWAKWGFAQDYIQEEIDEGHKVESLSSLLSMAQVRATERIYSYVWEFIKKNQMRCVTSMVDCIECD